MAQPSTRPTASDRASGSGRPPARPDDYALPLAQLSAALLVVKTGQGALHAATQSGLALLLGRADKRETLPAKLPSALSAACESVPLGETTEWRPVDRPETSILCTRYSLGRDMYVISLRENKPRPDVLTQRLHRQRLEITGRLVAMIAHDLRVPLTSIVFNADVAYERHLSAEELTLALADIRSAAARMRRSIDGLLDFARLGATASVVEVGDVISRVESLLRPQVRDGSHKLQIEVHPQASWIRGNPLVVEQVLVNLLINAFESSGKPVTVRMKTVRVRSVDATASQRALHPGEDLVCLLVEDDGPGVPHELRERIFEPFFTTKPEGTGLGLPMAREALASIGAALTLESSPRGARFALWFAWLPADAQERPR